MIEHSSEPHHDDEQGAAEPEGRSRRPASSALPSLMNSRIAPTKHATASDERDETVAGPGRALLDLHPGSFVTHRHAGRLTAGGSLVIEPSFFGHRDSLLHWKTDI